MRCVLLLDTANFSNLGMSLDITTLSSIPAHWLSHDTSFGRQQPLKIQLRSAMTLPKGMQDDLMLSCELELVVCVVSGRLKVSPLSLQFKTSHGTHVSLQGHLGVLTEVQGT